MKTKIKRVYIEQVKDLLALSIHTFEETFSDSNSKENMTDYIQSTLTEEKLGNQLIDKNSEFYFISENEEPVGFLKINVDSSQTESMDDDSLEVERIYILRSKKEKDWVIYLLRKQ